MRPVPSFGDAGDPGAISWAFQMRAISRDEPQRVAKAVTGAILGCGGWVLSRSATDTGLVAILFEFERGSCLEIYSVLIAAGLQLSHKAHIRFTELCQCTRLRGAACNEEIISIELEIRTLHVGAEETTL